MARGLARYAVSVPKLIGAPLAQALAALPWEAWLVTWPAAAGRVPVVDIVADLTLIVAIRAHGHMVGKNTEAHMALQEDINRSGILRVSRCQLEALADHKVWPTH
jgi:hypothetical protein